MYKEKGSLSYPKKPDETLRNPKGSVASSGARGLWSREL